MHKICGLGKGMTWTSSSDGCISRALDVTVTCKNHCLSNIRVTICPHVTDVYKGSYLDSDNIIADQHLSCVLVDSSVLLVDSLWTPDKSNKSSLSHSHVTYHNSRHIS